MHLKRENLDNKCLNNFPIFSYFLHKVRLVWERCKTLIANSNVGNPEFCQTTFESGTEREGRAFVISRQFLEIKTFFILPIFGSQPTARSLTDFVKANFKDVQSNLCLHTEKNDECGILISRQSFDSVTLNHIYDLFFYFCIFTYFFIKALLFIFYTSVAFLSSIDGQCAQGKNFSINFPYITIKVYSSHLKEASENEGNMRACCSVHMIKSLVKDNVHDLFLEGHQ